MISTKPHQPPLVQFYEKVHDKVYTILRHGLIFSYTDIVRVDRINSELRLDIKTDQEPETVTINGREYTPLSPRREITNEV